MICVLLVDLADPSFARREVLVASRVSQDGPEQGSSDVSLHHSHWRACAGADAGPTSKGSDLAGGLCPRLISNRFPGDAVLLLGYPT